MIPAGEGLPARQWSFGPFSRVRFGVVTSYVFCLIVPFTGKRASVQWQLVIFDRPKL
jgi:hypothetical protein